MSWLVFREFIMTDIKVTWGNGANIMCMKTLLLHQVTSPVFLPLSDLAYVALFIFIRQARFERKIKDISFKSLSVYVIRG